jgi:DNA-binding beta-propeller fold protein YncE
MDSIPLTGDGNAAFGAVGSDGLLYVMSTGNYFSGEGRLSVIDPLDGTELASFAGFGTGPGNLAADADAHVFVSSYTEGVMEFDADSNKVVRGAGQGVPIASNATVAVDSKGRVYGIETGACSGGQPGKAHVLDATLAETGTIELGECPVGSTVVQIPPE